MTKIVSLISSGIARPDAVLHLPLLWQNISQDALGKIADSYPWIGTGYDSMINGALTLSADAVRSFINDSKPNYLQFEAWVAEQPGVKLDLNTIKAVHNSITGYIHDDAIRQGMLSANGPSHGNPRDAINLNNLEDWLEFHAVEIA